MQTEIKIIVDMKTGLAKVACGGLDPLQTALVLSQVTATLIAQNSHGLAVAIPQRPISVFNT